MNVRYEHCLSGELPMLQRHVLELAGELAARLCARAGGQLLPIFVVGLDGCVRPAGCVPGATHHESLTALPLAPRLNHFADGALHRNWPVAGGNSNRIRAAIELHRAPLAGGVGHGVAAHFRLAAERRFLIAFHA
jgi:hypothetical protein